MAETITAESGAETVVTAQETTQSWRDQLPDELRGSASLASFPDQKDEAFTEMAKSLVNAQALIGSKRVEVPGKNASEEQKAEFYSALGRPEKADDYQMPTEGIPESAQGVFPEEMVNAYQETSHRLGLTPDQAAGIYRWYAEQTASAIELDQQNENKTHEGWVNDLKTELGNSFQEKTNLAKATILQFGDDELKEVLNSTGLGNNPAVVRWAAKIGQALASDEIIGQGGTKQFRMSPAEAQSAINAKNLDTGFMEAYRDDRHAGHKAALQEMKELFESAYPNEPLTPVATSSITT